MTWDQAPGVVALTTRNGSPDAGPPLPADVRAALTRIAVGDRISAAVLSTAFTSIAELAPPARDAALGSVMATVMARGPVADEVEALLRAALALDARDPSEVIADGDRPVLTLAGSGKKGTSTLNVSTPAALVAAAAGAKVIKVGSAATSSALGSRDLVRVLGLPEQRTAAGVRAALSASGFAFVAVEPQIPVLDRVYGGRFYAPNPFSFGLAPLVSPARGDITVFGLSHPRVEVAARVLLRFGVAQADVLCTRLPGGQYLDEIGPAGCVYRCRVRSGHAGAVEAYLAGDLLRDGSPGALPPPAGPEEAAERAGDLLAGGGLRCHRDLVAVNAGYLLMLSGIAASVAEGKEVAENALLSGAGLAVARANRAAQVPPAASDEGGKPPGARR